MVRDVLKAASANHYGCCTFRQHCIYLSSWQPPAQPKSNSGVKYDQRSKKTCLCERTTLTLHGPSAAFTLAYGYVFDHATTCRRVFLATRNISFSIQLFKIGTLTVLSGQKNNNIFFSMRFSLSSSFFERLGHKQRIFKNSGYCVSV